MKTGGNGKEIKNGTFGFISYVGTSEDLFVWALLPVGQGATLRQLSPPINLAPISPPRDAILSPLNGTKELISSLLEADSCVIHILTTWPRKPNVAMQQRRHIDLQVTHHQGFVQGSGTAASVQYRVDAVQTLEPSFPAANGDAK